MITDRDLEPGMPLLPALHSVVVEPLALAEVAAFNPVLDQWLRPNSSIPSGADLPLLVGAEARSLRLVARRDGQPKSHAALFVHEYKLPGLRFSVGVIGAVATAPDARGQGLATTVLLSLIDEAAARGVDVLVLWSEADVLYERLGFVRAGQEVLSLVHRDEVHGLCRRRVVRPMRPPDVRRVVELHSREEFGPIRTREQWQASMSIPRTAWFVLEDNHEIVAYGVVGKGADLSGCVHEWGGEETALPLLVSGLFRFRPEEELVVLSPAWKETAVRALEFHGVASQSGVLGMIRALAPAELCPRLGIDPASIEASDDHVPMVEALFGKAGRPGRIPLYLFGLDSM